MVIAWPIAHVDRRQSLCNESGQDAKAQPATLFMHLPDLLTLPFAPPSLPRAEVLLMAELDAGAPDLRRVDQLLASDPALSLLILRQANSKSYGLSGLIHSVSEALAVLSLRRVREIVLENASALSTFGQVPGLPLEQFWRYSVDCAKVARSLAAFLRLNQQAAYTAGLLHGLGLLMMRKNMPQVLALDVQLPPMGLLRARLERHSLGFCFSQVSGQLARQAGLPGVIGDALDYQHEPFDNEAYEPLAGVLNLAVWRARTLQAGLKGNHLTVTFPSEVAEVLGLDIDMVLQQDPIDWSAQNTGFGRL